MQETVTGFLKTWYLDRDIDSLQRFIASDNMVADERNQLIKGESSAAMWRQAFREEIRALGNSVRADSLDQIIAYIPPKMPPGRQPLKYLNAGEGALPKDPFAIIDINSLPIGSLLPKPGLEQNEGGVGPFLARLVTAYGSKDSVGPQRLAIVVYLLKLKEPRLIVTYWILEEGKWKLATYRETD